jgi:hypothetical protein
MRVLVVVLVAAAFVSPAWATDEPLPWASGPNDTSEAEALFGAIATGVAGRPATVRCWDPNGFDALKANLGVPATAPAFTNLLTGTIEMSPGPCWTLNAARSGVPDRLLCGEAIEYRIVKKRIRVNGRWRIKRKRVAIHVPAPPLCREASSLGSAAGLLGHESYHVAGVIPEPEADCKGIQRIADVLAGIGVNLDYANELMYLIVRYTVQVNPVYRSVECAENRAFDLKPFDGIWP